MPLARGPPLAPDHLHWYTVLGCFECTASGCPTSPGSAGTRADSINFSSRLRPGSSVVERGPEKAGVGGSIPSLATTFQFLPIYSSRAALRPLSAAKWCRSRPSERPASAVQSRPWPPSPNFPKITQTGRAPAFERREVGSPAASHPRPTPSTTGQWEPHAGSPQKE